MNKENLKEVREADEALYAKYPKLLRQFKKSPKETCLCWGIVPGPGWISLVQDMLIELEKLRKKKLPDLQLSQSKEKFGLLRVYLDNFSDEAWDIVNKYEAASAKVCIMCGKPGRMFTNGWVRVHCKKCEDKYQKDRS